MAKSKKAEISDRVRNQIRAQTIPGGCFMNLVPRHFTRKPLYVPISYNRAGEGEKLSESLTFPQSAGSLTHFVREEITFKVRRGLTDFGVDAGPDIQLESL